MYEIEYCECGGVMIPWSIEDSPVEIEPECWVCEDCGFTFCEGDGVL